MSAKSILAGSNDRNKKEKSSNKSSSSGTFGDDSLSLAGQLFNGVKAVRTWNNAAKATGNYTPSKVDAALSQAFPSAQTFNDKVQSVLDQVFFDDKSLGEAVTSNLKNRHTPSYGSSAKPITYSDWSPAANYFGMDQDTAYAEHMANTAHQREVADLKAAGLNPVLGISGSGSSGVAGSVASSGSSAQKSLSSDALVDLIGATASVVTMLVSKNPSLGLAVGKVAQAGGNLLLDD